MEKVQFSSWFQRFQSVILDSIDSRLVVRQIHHGSQEAGVTVGGENPGGAMLFPSLFHLGTILWGGAAHIQGASSTLNSSLEKTHSEVQVIGLLGISQSKKPTIKILCPRIPWRGTKMQNTIPEFVSHVRKDSKKVSHVAYLSATLSSYRMS